MCLGCLSEINHCYTFKIKCENSSRTLRQLLPNALPEEPDQKVCAKETVDTAELGVQTIDLTPRQCTSSVQTDTVSTAEAEQNTSLEKPDLPEDLEEDEGEVFDYELTDAPEEKTQNIILHLQDSLKNEKEVVFTQTDVIYEGDDNELEQQIRECNMAIFETADGEAEIVELPSPQVTTRNSAAKLQMQQQKPVRESAEKKSEAKSEEEPPTAKRTSRRRPPPQPEEQVKPPTVATASPAKQLRLGSTRKSLNSVSVTIPGATAASLTAELKYHCDRCNAGFALEKSLIIHKRQKGCTNRNFKCNECERVFVSPEHLAEHQATHGTHTCAECGLQFESKEQLGKHMVQGHKRNLRNQCNICQKGEFDYRNALLGN